MNTLKQDSHLGYWKTLFTKYNYNQPTVLIRLFLEIVVTCGLILLIGVPRLLDLNSFVTTDETLWLVRSGSFYKALSHHDYAATFQKSHPGVTVMWAGLTGYMRVYPDYKDQSIGLGVLAKRDFTMPLRILTAGRQAMVLFHLLALGLSFLFARKLFGMMPALMGFLLIAFDPFHIALSRVLHLDGLLADLMLLSLLAFLVYLDDHKTGILLVSAIAAGLAWLTKSPGLFLIPLITLLAFIDHVRLTSKQNKSEWWKSILQPTKALVIWGLVGALVVFLLWPAMWVDPLGSLVRVFRDAIGYAEAGHESAVFFNGHIYTNGEIPDISFYPINFLWRTTPVTLLGLIAGFVLFIRKIFIFKSGSKLQVSDSNSLSESQNNRKSLLQRMDRQVWALAALLLFAVGFSLLMSLGLKKFDRYILPSIVPIDLVAGICLVWLTQWIVRSFREKPRAIVTGIILLSLVAVQAALAWTVFPYYFDYYNPLLGGSQRAADVMQIGWGEGLDQAARYINSKPNSEQTSSHCLVWKRTILLLFQK